MSLVRALPLCALLLGLPASASPIKTPPKKSKVVVYDQVSSDQIAGLLTQRGYSYEILAAPERNTAFKFQLSTLTVLLLMNDRGSGRAQDVYMYAGFKAQSTMPIDAMNRWNQGARFTRAYIDQEGDPVLESDLRLNGGVTAQAFFDFIDTFDGALIAFAKEIGFD